MPRITWTDKRHGTEEGRVNGLDLFTLNFSTIRSGPKFLLNTRLPFRTVGIDMHGDDADVLKESAERLLVAYVTALGAVFPDA